MKLPEPGELFEGRYQIDAVLGEGGFARVFRARDTSVARSVALKVLWPREHGYARTIAARFMREARVVAELQDPHTITMYDYGERPDGLLWMACEFVDGRDLAQVLRDEGRLSQPVVMHILAQILSSLREAHGRGILHRDIKPANILIHEYAGDPYSVKLIDFGLAKSSNPDSTKITREGRITGTPRYMAPEQLFGGELSPRSDIYSLGLVVYEMLTGRPAIEGAKLEELVREQVGGPPVQVPRELADELFGAIVERMCAREHSARYPNAAQIEREVRQIIRHARPRERGSIDPEPASPPAPVRREPVRSQRERPARPAPSARPAEPPRAGLSWPFVIVVVALGVVAAAGWVIIQTEPEATKPAAKRGANLDGLVGSPTTTPPKTAEAEPEAPVEGCRNLEAYKPGYQRLAMMRGLERQEVDVYIPPDYEPTVPHPTIWFFHDLTADPRTVLSSLDFDAVKDLSSYVIIAPVGSNLTMWGGPREVEDAHALIEAAHEFLCADPDRVFVWGHGFGGRPATRHAMCLGGIAAIATTNYRERRLPTLCEPRQAVPYLSISARNDPVAPFGGGKGCYDHLLAMSCPSGKCAEFTPSHGTVQRFFRERHACEGRAQSPADIRAESCRTWDCESPFVSCTAEGGRSLPGVPNRSKATCASAPPADFPYLRTVYEFFGQHELPEHAESSEQ